ncbi:MAG: hypothetical protein C5B53_03890 [Candidatus Melainabacteria bacterium]|nr:MAG: hypothetical protein C5B53_03890 [Candidatus Melainabacteria bacterium]
MSFVEEVRQIRNSLLRPKEQLVNFNAQAATTKTIPYGLWICLALLAVIGTTTYGASLGYVYSSRFLNPLVLLWVTAVLTGPAGISWLIFGLVLTWFTRLNPLTGCYVCLITMAYGGMILMLASLVNLVMGMSRPAMTVAEDICGFNEIFLIILDVLMAWFFTAQMRALGKPIWKTLTAWVIVLNGSFLLLSVLVSTTLLAALGS